MGRWDGELSYFGKISEALPMRGLLWGTGIDSAYSWSGDEVDGGKLPVAGDADGGGLCGPTYLGRWAWDGDLFLGIFEKDWGNWFLSWVTVACRVGR